MPDPLTQSLLGIGAATQVGSAIAGGKGGEDRPAVQIPRVAIEAAETGLAAAREGLEVTPAPSPEQLQQTSQDVLARLQELQAVDPTIDAQRLTEEIVRAQQVATAPQRARAEQAFQEAAGAFGPSAELSSQRAAQVAQERSQVAQTIAALMPQLQQLEFQQYGQRLQQALGLQQAIQQAALIPYQAVTGARQAYTGQLLGAGQAAFAPQPTQQYVSPVPAAFGRVGSELTQIPLTLQYLEALQAGGQRTAGGGGAGGGAGAYTGIQ